MPVTTIDMINILRVGQIAKCMDEQEFSFGVKIIDGNYYWIDGDGTQSSLFSLSSEAMLYNWEIIQEFVDFSEAIKAFICGKKIFSHDLKGNLCNEYEPEFDDDSYIAIREILDCNWSIED